MAISALGMSLWAWIFVAALIVTICLVIFGRRPQPELSNQETAPAQTSEAEFLQIDKYRIHFVQEGRGADVVLLQGIGASIYIWRFVIPRLAKSYRITAVDLAGFGQSSKEATHDYGLDSQSDLILKIVAKLNLKRPHLVGSSMGGAIALWLARTSPDRVGKVIALSPATDPTRIPKSARHLAVLAPFLRNSLNPTSMRLILRRVLRRRELINDDVVENYLRPFRDQGASIRAFSGALKLLSDRRLPGGLKGLAGEALILYGEGDQIVSRKSMRALTHVLPETKFVYHETAGHHLMEDEPDWLCEQIESFLGPSTTA